MQRQDPFRPRADEDLMSKLRQRLFANWLMLLVWGVMNADTLTRDGAIALGA